MCQSSHLVARRTEVEVVKRAQQILEYCTPRGGYARGSANSVTNYIPVDNCLARIKMAHRFNGRQVFCERRSCLKSRYCGGWTPS